MGSEPFTLWGSKMWTKDARTLPVMTFVAIVLSFPPMAGCPLPFAARRAAQAMRPATPLSKLYATGRISKISSSASSSGGRKSRSASCIGYSPRVCRALQTGAICPRRTRLRPAPLAAPWAKGKRAASQAIASRLPPIRCRGDLLLGALASLILCVHAAQLVKAEIPLDQRQ